jgi:hypothetical protein
VTSGRRPLSDLVLDREGLAQLPEPEPLIEDTLDRRTVALVAGYHGTLKSFLVQDWAACIATGRMWQRREVQGGRVLYVAAEGAHGLNPRFTAWEYAWQRTIPADRLHVIPVPVNLMHADEVTELCDLARGVDLVILDTLARCLVGADENSARDMGIAVDALYRLRDATGNGTVLAAHHTGKDRQTTRGSSALEAGVDTVYTTEGDSRLMVLARTKRKDGPIDDSLRLKLSPASLSACLVSAIGADMRPTMEALMSAFMSAFGDNGATKRELREVAGMAPATFQRALTDLLKQGALVNTGTDLRPFYKAAPED